MLEHHRRGTCLKDTGILVDMHMPHTHIYIYTQLFISKKKKHCWNKGGRGIDWNFLGY